MRQALHANELIFWVRPFDGWTRQLRDHCLELPNKASNIRILVEGPYYRSTPVHNCETVLLIACGTGIAGVLPYILEHIRWAADPTDSQVHTHTIHLVSGQHARVAFIRDLCATELQSALSLAHIHTNFFSGTYNWWAKTIHWRGKYWHSTRSSS